MLRATVTALCVLCAAQSVGRADEYTGKVKDLDEKKNTITITTADKDPTFPLAKDVSVFYEVKPTKKNPAGGLEHVPGGLAGIKAGYTVTLTTEKKDDKETVSLIKLESPLPKDTKKK